MGNCSTILRIKARSIADLSEEMHKAVQAGSHDLAKKLLGDGAPVDARDDYGYTPLNVAVSKRDVQMMQLLVAAGADKDALNCTPGRSHTPLVVASGEGDHVFAEALLSAGADVSLRPQRFTALDMATRRGHVVVLAVLIRHGVNVNDSGWHGTALHHAARRNKADVIDILVGAGADTEKTGICKRSKPLHEASSELQFEAVVALLKHGADINARDGNGLTSLHAAARQAGKRGAAEMVDLLLRLGADETAACFFGTPADIVGHSAASEDEVGGVERVRRLLANAPAERAWRRRGLLVASRARPQMVVLRTGTQEASGVWVDLMGRVLGLAEEGVLRTIVGYL